MNSNYPRKPTITKYQTTCPGMMSGFPGPTMNTSGISKSVERDIKSG
jgi:hypothetical protein